MFQLAQELLTKEVLNYDDITAILGPCPFGDKRSRFNSPDSADEMPQSTLLSNWMVQWQWTKPSLLITAKSCVVLLTLIHRFQNVIEGKLPQSSHDFSLTFPGGLGGPVWGVGTSDFKCRGLSKDFGGFKNSIPGFFGGGKFGRYIFWVGHFTRDFLGIQNNLKIPGSALVSSPG